MAELDSTLRTPFAKRKFAAKTNFFTSPTNTPAHLTEPARIISGAQSVPELSKLLNETLPTTLETLRSHVNYLLRIPLPVGEKNRLLLKYWAMECRLDAVCLLLDEAQASGVVLAENEIDLPHLDLSNFSLTHLNLQNLDWAESY